MNSLRALAVCSGIAVGIGGGATAAGSAPAPLVKNTTGWITALAMDGSQIAYATESFAPTNCFKLLTWNVSTRGGVLVSGPKTGRCGDDEPHGQRIRQVAIAGTRVAWIRNITGNTESDDSLFTNGGPKSKEVRLASAMRTGDTSGGALRGRWIGGLVGSGTLLAVNTWTTNAAGAVINASLSLIGQWELSPVATGTGVITAESADTGRIAVARADGSVGIYSATGELLRAIVPSSVRELALVKGTLVVLTQEHTLEIYNVQTRELVRSRPVPGGATSLDVQAGIAVFTVYRKLYAMQLATGKQAVLATEKRAIIAARIEAPGVVYAYNTVRGGKSIGNLVFLPLARVKTALG